ncbi:MAG: hypothetical protein QOJ15_2253 [Bradyrhizobium sp.]|jgi:hypothetical protein|nr:hypothetical protein [Bradyrhizobium sp.]
MHNSGAPRREIAKARLKLGVIICEAVIQYSGTPAIEPNRRGHVESFQPIVLSADSLGDGRRALTR